MEIITTKKTINPSQREQLTIFDAPTINTDEPLHIGNPRLRPIPWEEALDQIIALGNALKSKKKGH